MLMKTMVMAGNCPMLWLTSYLMCSGNLRRKLNALCVEGSVCIPKINCIPKRAKVKMQKAKPKPPDKF
jgi:hypothetical protein